MSTLGRARRVLKFKQNVRTRAMARDAAARLRNLLEPEARRATFDLAKGHVIAVGGSGPGGASIAPIAGGTGWHRCSVGGMSVYVKAAGQSIVTIDERGFISIPGNLVAMGPGSPQTLRQGTLQTGGADPTGGQSAAALGSPGASILLWGAQRTVRSTPLAYGTTGKVVP